MKRFTLLFQQIDATTSTNEKVNALQRYFLQEQPANAAWALYLLLGKTRKRLITSRVLRDVFLQISDIPAWLFEDCYAHVGDSAEVIALLLKDTPIEQQTTVELPLHHWMENVIPTVKGLASEAELKDRIVSWWSVLDSFEVFVLNKVLTGAFRVGVSDKLVIKGLSAAYSIPESVLAHRLMGDFEPTIAFFQQLIQQEEDEQLSPSRPYPFFLAAPLEEERFQQEPDFSRWQAEWKWDGIRAQIIRRAGEVFIWSRGEDLVTEQFPEIAEFFLTLPDGLVFDGEILCWEGNRPLSFNHLQKRLGRKRVTQKIMRENPVHFIAYDLLEWDGQDIRSKPFGDRRQLLVNLLNPLDSRWISYSTRLSFDTFDDLKLLEGTVPRAGGRRIGAESPG
ncbi:ATP-dependent DNA ligase [Kovacikia minuta]|uniref:ATP-dependent DNA ligase n=1 Tax=Kovacikia minuta TaxID=2931930 RepID=UPI0020C75B6C